MKIIREDGSVLYYYYKKKRGRHKKTGPKKKDIRTTYKYYSKLCEKYVSKYEFKSRAPKSYKYCEEKGWIGRLYPYVCRYTKKECEDLCEAYQNSEELKEKDPVLYECLISHNWIKDFFTWRVERFTSTNCYNEALKYKTYKEFRTSSSTIYYHCLHSGLIKEYEWLEDDRINIYKDRVDCVYMYMFEKENAVYIGRTLECRVDDRDREHLYSNDVVAKFGKEKDLPVPKMVILESGLTLNEGLDREDFYVTYYRGLGYTVLNKAKTGVGVGSIGNLGRSKWNKETCYQAALKCKSRTEFDNTFPAANKVARNNGWIDEYTWFSEKPKYNYWNYERCKEVAGECTTRTEFEKKSSRAYGVSLKNKWIEDFFPKKKKEKNMKKKIFYKIDPVNMKIIECYNKVKEITDDVKIYRVLNGDVELFDDGYLYRRDEDVLKDGDTNIITDLLKPLSKMEKKEEKYEFVIDLLKNSNLKIKEICRISNDRGIKICEMTCRRLKKEFCNP